MDLGLTGKTALITGASQGVGRATSQLLAAEGCNLVMIARTQADLDRVARSILAEHRIKVASHSCDLGVPGAAEALFAEHRAIDILINNAGAIPAGTIGQVDEAAWRTAWDLKVFGYIALTRCYFPHMAERGSGVILNVMGASGDRAGPGTIAIGMGNSTLNAMTKAIGGTSAEHGVRVVGINPGPVATDRGVAMMRHAAKARFGDPGRWRELTVTMPFGRMAEPEEIASAIVFLVSPRASYVSGAVLNVDGGMANRVTGY